MTQVVIRRCCCRVLSDTTIAAIAIHCAIGDSLSMSVRIAVDDVAYGTTVVTSVTVTVFTVCSGSSIWLRFESLWFV